VVTWAGPCWSMSAVRFVLAIGGSKVERRCLWIGMGSRSFAVNALEAEVLETVMDDVGYMVGEGVSGFANSVCAECCLVVALGEQELGLMWTMSDPERVVPKGEEVESSWSCSRDEVVDAYFGPSVCDLGHLVCLSEHWRMLVAVGGRKKSWVWVRMVEWAVRFFDISQLCVPQVA
jgi:hypothetical protein